MKLFSRLLFLATLFGLSACHRAKPARSTAHSQQGTPAPGNAAKSSLPEFAVDAVDAHEGTAFWYDVPEQSLPQRRAWTGELTAASDSLPLNTYVRVSRLDGKGDAKAVVVRITDTGLRRKDGLIDLNREAAEALGMVRAGETKVRVETLALKNATTDKPVDKKGGSSAPKASEISGTPAAGQQAEKNAADAKDGK